LVEEYKMGMMKIVTNATIESVIYSSAFLCHSLKICSQIFCCSDLAHFSMFYY